jgi:integrase
MARARFQDPPLQTAGTGKDAYYFVRFRVYREDGSSTRKQVTIGLKSQLSKSEAKKKKQEIISKETSQIPKVLPSGGVVTFEKFYEEGFLVMKSDWSPAHRDNFKYQVEHYILPKFGSLAIDSISKVQIQSFLNSLGSKYSASTLRHIREKFVGILEEAVDQDFIPKNPAKKTKIPEAARPASKPVFTAKQLIALIDKITDARDKALFLSGTFCALRTSEVFGLPWKNFHHEAGKKTGYFLISQIAFEGEQFDRTKNKASKAHVHISEKTLKAILQWKKEAKDTSPDALMFPSTNRNGRARTGAPMWPGAWLKKRIQPLAEEIGVGFPVNFRCTRRTAATLIQDQGSSTASAQGVLRHASPSTTADVYTQQVPESVKKAVNDYEALVYGSRPKLQRVK